MIKDGFENVFKVADDIAYDYVNDENRSDRFPKAVRPGKQGKAATKTKKAASLTQTESISETISNKFEKYTDGDLLRILKESRIEKLKDAQNTLEEAMKKDEEM